MESSQENILIRLENGDILTQKIADMGIEKVYKTRDNKYYVGEFLDNGPLFRLASQTEAELIKRLPKKQSPQQRLIALLDELGIKNWVSGIPHKWDEPETGWQVFIVQDDIENPGYYHYAQFTFGLKGEFVDYEFGGEWKEPETPV